MSRLCVLLLAMLIALSALPAHASTIEEYRDQVRQTRQRLEIGLQAATASDRQNARETAARALTQITNIDLTSMTNVVPDNNRLQARLRDADVADADVLADLRALELMLQKLPPVDSAESGRTLNVVNARLRAPTDNPITDFLTRLLLDLSRALNDGFSDARNLWAVLGFAALIVLGAFLIRSYRNALAREARLPDTPDDDTPVSSRAALDRAQQLAESGDLREAVRQLYLGTLLILDERGKLRFDRALTNYETLRAVRKSGAESLAEALQPIVDTYDRVWYGFASIDAATYQTYRAQVEQVKVA
jgi:outer membrane murein-binding lipoprotein Lpp